MNRRLSILGFHGVSPALFLNLLCMPAESGAADSGSNNCNTPLAGERWEIRSTSPGPREQHTAIWSGSEMLVWGGGAGGFLNDGGRYNPITDAWQPINLTNAPSGRWFHEAVWTGTEMLVWGGRSTFWPDASKNDGGRYNPLSDVWRPISTNGAPSPRAQFAAVWTGTEMLVWGGIGDGWAFIGTGGRYNPASDTWAVMNTNGAPSARLSPAFVWTGSEMIIWGGGIFPNQSFGPILPFGDGARYNPATDQWTPLSTNGAPPAVADPLFVWSGKDLIVWGGSSASGALTTTVDTGGRYDPATDSWRSLSPVNTPTSRAATMAVWTGDEMLMWGGVTLSAAGSGGLNSGGRYNPECDTWNPLTLENPPPAREDPRMVWSGQALLIFGGNINGTDYDSNFAWIPGRPPVSPAITGQPQSLTALAGTNVVFSVIVTGSPPVSYQWTLNRTNIAGANGASLVLTNIQLEDEGEYRVAVTNAAGGLVSDAAILSVLAPPRIITQPKGKTAYWGDIAAFFVKAKGSPPLSYLWYKDGFPISWATNAIFDLADLQLTDGASYWVVITNRLGSITSAPALLIVNPIGVSLGLYPGVTIAGVVGKTYGLQFSTSVSLTNSWTSLTNLTLTQPVQLWLDSSVETSSGQQPRRFYRVVPLP